VAGRIRADGPEHTPLDESAVLKAARSLVQKSGVEALAIAFLHSYANPSHELRARDLVDNVFRELLITCRPKSLPKSDHPRNEETDPPHSGPPIRPPDAGARRTDR
jgi:N-methylhydantoinase A